MTEFDKYLELLAAREETKARATIDARHRVLVQAGVQLNWMGDYLGNPALQYEAIDVPLDFLQLTSTTPAWNKILLDRCHASVEKFRELVEREPEMFAFFLQETAEDDTPILVVESMPGGGYSVFDGMHRVIAAILRGKPSVQAFRLLKDKGNRPFCEPHVVYDLIRGFQRNARDTQGRSDLYHALRLLCRAYANVEVLLRERFNLTFVPDAEVQHVIGEVLGCFQDQKPVSDHA